MTRREPSEPLLHMTAVDRAQYAKFCERLAATAGRNPRVADHLRSAARVARRPEAGSFYETMEF